MIWRPAAAGLTQGSSASVTNTAARREARLLRDALGRSSSGVSPQYAPAQETTTLAVFHMMTTSPVMDQFST
jgi:hypothetical protein